MTENTPSSKNKSGLRRLRSRTGVLCIIFAGAAVAVCGAAASQTRSPPSPPADALAPAPLTPPFDDVPVTLQAFGGRATQIPSAGEAGQWPMADWAALMREQKQFMANAANAQGYNSFLATFNKYRGEPLAQMAKNVSALEENDITYSLYSDGDPWVAPGITEMNRKGDCKDQAALQYAVMRYLDVPVNRLFMAFVNVGVSTGSVNDVGGEHMVLLVNTASAGQPEDFLVLNDGGPVLDSNGYISHDGKSYKPVRWSTEDGDRYWPHPYIFDAAINDAGVWETSQTLKLYGPRTGQKPDANVSVHPAQSPQKVRAGSRPRLKSQVARVNPPVFRRYGKV